jgi:hypothetical protein
VDVTKQLFIWAQIKDFHSEFLGKLEQALSPWRLDTGIGALMLELVRILLSLQS